MYTNKKLVLKGWGASPGKAEAAVSIIKDFRDYSLMKEGNVLVAPMTSPPWFTIMMKASAVVTELGGVLSHPAIVCRELGIPAVVAAKGATKKLRDGEVVLVDGSSGKIYEIKNG